MAVESMRSLFEVLDYFGLILVSKYTFNSLPHTP